MSNGLTNAKKRVLWVLEINNFNMEKGAERSLEVEDIGQLVDCIIATAEALLDSRLAAASPLTFSAFDAIMTGRQGPVSLTARLKREVTLKDGTKVVMLFNPDQPLDDGTKPMRVHVFFPQAKKVNIGGIDNYPNEIGVANYRARQESDDDEQPRAHGYQISLMRGAFEKLPLGEEVSPSAKVRALSIVHRVLTDGIYGPLEECRLPARGWFKRIFGGE